MYSKKKFNTYVPWGILTGIRPVKIVHNLLDKGKDDDYIRQNLKNKYLYNGWKNRFSFRYSKKRKSIYVSYWWK